MIRSRRDGSALENVHNGVVRFYDLQSKFLRHTFVTCISPSEPCPINTGNVPGLQNSFVKIYDNVLKSLLFILNRNREFGDKKDQERWLRSLHNCSIYDKNRISDVKIHNLFNFA